MSRVEGCSTSRKSAKECSLAFRYLRARTVSPGKENGIMTTQGLLGEGASASSSPGNEISNEAKSRTVTHHWMISERSVTLLRL